MRTSASAATKKSASWPRHASASPKIRARRPPRGISSRLKTVMPTAFTEHIEPTPPPHKRWTRAECEALASTGVWDLQRYELINGELVTKMPKNRPHLNTLTALFEWLLDVFGKGYVQSEAPIDVAPEDNPTNEPEADLIVLAKPYREF